MRKSKQLNSTTIQTVFPADTARTLRLASENWESFVSTGRFQDLTPRQVICESWVKSRSNGLDPSSTRAPTSEKLNQILKQSDLTRAAKPVLDKLAVTLTDSRHVVVLADAKGRILYSVGHEQLQHQLEEINFRPGGIWSETAVGPNGVGTPLALGRPELVMGHEHYCQGWQPWVCYGAPIPGGYQNSPLGVIDITGPVDRIRSETMSLAITLAESVHTGLSFLQLQRREILRSVCRDRILRWPNDGVLVLDENGYIIDYNAKAARLMNLEFPDCVETPVTQWLPDIWQVAHRSIQQNMLEEMQLEMQTASGLNNTLKVRIEPVLHAGQDLGALLVISGQNIAATRGRSHQPSAGNSTRYTFEHIHGQSAALQAALSVAHAAARDPLNSSVLLIGETGTGKELMAQSIHAESNRAEQPFIAINCGALPHELIESELFGYVAGTFTGARKEGLKGKFEHASGGTLFLDEIDSLDSKLQTKFLRVLDNNEITRIGSVQAIHVDVRIIAAASPNLGNMVEQGNFRQDLFHRLSVLDIVIPPLRMRGDDIIDLAHHFLETECWAAGRQVLTISEAVKQRLREYPWPGNVRELHNLCKRCVLMVEGDCILVEHLPQQFTDLNNATVSGLDRPLQIAAEQSLRKISDQLIQSTLLETAGNISKAARILGIDRTTIYRRQKAWQQQSMQQQV